MDYLIQNTELFDGYQITSEIDVLVRNGKVVEIEKNIEPSREDVTIDASGLILSPGFIDIHTHTDLSIAYSDCANLLSQGITLVVGGNCGISGGLNNDTSIEGVINVGGWNTPTWKNIGEYWDFVQTQKIAVHYASLVGYHTLIEESKTTGVDATLLLNKYLMEGYFGLSTGMVYGWGKEILKTEDILDLARTLSANKTVLASHVKDQGVGLYDSIKLLTDLWNFSGTEDLSIQISHLKHMFASDPNGHETLNRVFSLIEENRALKKSISIDVYPYTAGSTSLGLKDRHKQCLNEWFDVFPFGYDISIGEMSQKSGKKEEKIVSGILSEKKGLLKVPPIR